MAITQLTSTLAYNQWVEPKAIKSGSDTYFSGTKSSNGYAYVGKVTDGTVTTQLIENGVEVDDHNAPAVLARPGKTVLVAWSRHDQSAISNIHIAAEGTLNFVDKGNLSWSGNCTYNQFLDFGDDVWLFSRVNGKWAFRKSTGWPTATSSFGSEVTFLDFASAYPIFRESSTAGLWHVAIAPNPDADSYLKYGTIDLDSGDISSGGSVIGNMDGTNLPLADTDFQDLAPTQRSDQHIRLWDVTDLHGKAVVAYTKWENDSTTGNESRVMLAIGDTTTWEWERKDIELGQGKVIDQPDGRHYEGGVAFNRNGNDTLYVCWESGGMWRVKVHTVASDFTLDAGTSLDNVLDNTAKLIRPVAVQGADQVMYMKATSYVNFANLASSTWLVDG